MHAFYAIAWGSVLYNSTKKKGEKADRRRVQPPAKPLHGTWQTKMTGLARGHVPCLASSTWLLVGRHFSCIELTVTLRAF